MANYTQSGYDPSLNGYWKGTVDGAENFGYPQNYYFADTIRTLMIGFGNFFNELKVIRYDKFKVPTKIINIPIKFGPRKKSNDFRTEQETGKKYYIPLPNLTYKIDSMEFDTERAKGIYQERAFYAEFLEDAGITGDMADRFFSDVQPTPYNINITMDANCENISDALQIVEQVCVRFNPACFFNIKEFWFFNKRRSIKMLLNSTNWEVQSDAMGEEEWRQIKVSFSFKLEAILYKPVRDAQIIEKINTYLTLNKGDYLWHGSTFGNADGTLDMPHNFSDIYRTKVANAYVLDGQPVTTYDDKTSAYTTVYNYRKSDELTTYGKDDKLLVREVTRWIPAGMSADGPMIVHRRPVLYPDGSVSGYIEERSTTYTSEWMTEPSYVSMNGYGDLQDQTVSFGSKLQIGQYDDTPYDAYYSTYSEEGKYTESPAEFSAGRADFLYRKTSDPRYGNMEFSGGKYGG